MQLRRCLGQETIDKVVDQRVVDEVVVLQNDEHLFWHCLYHLVDEDHKEALPFRRDVFRTLEQ